MSTLWLVMLWCLANIIQNVLNTKKFTEPSPEPNWLVLQFVEVTLFQFLLGGISSTLWLKFVLGKPLHPTNVERKSLIIVVCGHFIGSLGINAAYSLHAWHMLGMIRGWEPAIMFVLLLILGYGKMHDLSGLVLLGVTMMGAGLSVFTTWYVKLTSWGVITAVLVTIAWTFRNVFMKSFDKSWDDPLQKYAIISVYGFLVLLPVVLAKLAFLNLVYSVTFPFMKLQLFLQQTTCEIANSFISIFVLERINPLFHAVLGTTIRMSVTIVTTGYLQMQLSWGMLTGTVLFVLGLFAYYAATYRGQRLIRNINFAIFAPCAIFSAHFLLVQSKTFSNAFKTMRTTRPFNDDALKNTLNAQENLSTSFQTFWVYDHPPPENILLNIQTLERKRLAQDIHVHCTTFRCVGKIRQMGIPRLTVSFLTLPKILKNSPLERWFSRHALHKLLSGERFEDHLHEAIRLALLWHYGGIYLDPFLSIRGLNFHEFDTQTPWVWLSAKNQSHGILELCSFPPKHPFIGRLSKEFVNWYSNMTYLSDKSFDSVMNFQHVSLKALLLFCIRKKNECPKFHSIQTTTTALKNSKNPHHYGVILDGPKTKFTSALENFVGAQFLPIVDSSVEIDSYKPNVNYSATVFVSKLLQTNKRTRLFPETTDPIVLSQGIDFQKKPSLKQMEFLRHRAPIGCRDTKTVEFLRNHEIPAYYSVILSLLVNSQGLSRNLRKKVYLVDIHTKVKRWLPAQIQQNAVVLEHLRVKKPKLNRHGWFRAVYTRLEKYASAKMIITQNIQCAFVAAVMDTPVVYINSSAILGMTRKLKANRDAKIFPQIFHVLSLNRIQNSRNITNFNFSQILGNPNASLLMRLRATSWNVIRKHQSLREAALKFGVVPFPRPTIEPVTNRTFHLVFTTSSKSSISVRGTVRIKGVFAWRHWRCVEAIFYHHPFAKVIIHSNTLSQSAFDVLVEAGYDIQVQAYSLGDLVKNTPAEKFVRDKLWWAKYGSGWYSHESDLLRLLVLFKWGGIYMDTDMHIVRSLSDLQWNILGWQHQTELNGAFLKFKKGHPFLKACLQEFSDHYSTNWAANGPELLTRIWKNWRTNDSKSTVHDIPRSVFYMFHYDDVAQQCFEDTSGPTFESNKNVLAGKAYVVHLNSKITGAYGTNKKIKEGTLCKYILNSFCVLCNNVY